jgi:hypothetical protein
MTYKTLLPVLALVLAGFLGACGKDKNAAGDDDFVVLDRTWDSSDNAFNTDYMAVRAQHDSMMARFNALASDSSVAADKRAAAQAKLDEHNKMLSEMETKRTQARTSRDAARTAKDRAAYEAAQREADYAAWRANLERIRTEQRDLEGQIFVGSRSVGGVDVNLKKDGDPVIRVEPGKNDTNTLIRVEPGKEDNKPLIEKNKNP